MEFGKSEKVTDFRGPKDSSTCFRFAKFHLEELSKSMQNVSTFSGQPL
jgi:hypothetical protein